MCIYKIIVKMVSVLLCVIMVFASSFFPKVYALPLVSSVYSFVSDNVFNTAMETIGLTLVDMSKSTLDDKDDKIASMINLWVFGGSTTESINILTAICQDVLDLVNDIDNKLDLYQADINKMLGEDKIDTYNTNLNNKWSQDVLTIEDTNYVDIALSKYKKYMEKAEEYVNGKISKAQLNKEKDELTMAFAKIYSLSNNGFDSEFDTAEQRKEIIFNNSTVTDEISSVIERLCLKLDSEYTYADSAAQFAYVVFPYSQMQYQYVNTAMLKQISEILLLQMMYQEFLSQKSGYFESEYFNDKYADSQSKRDNLDFSIKEFNSLNENISEDITAYFDRDLHISVVDNLYLNINDYAKPQDIGTVELKNTQFKSSYNNIQKSYFDDYFKDNGNKDTIDIKSKYYDDTVYFDKVSTLSENGVNMFYVLSDDNNADMHMKSMTSSYYTTKILWKTNMPSYWDFKSSFVSADYLNLTQGVYSDGMNTYKSVANENDLSDMFDNNYFKLVNSTPTQFLSDTLEYANGENVYLLSSNYDMTFDKSNWIEKCNINTFIDSYNFSKNQPSLPLEKSSYNVEESLYHENTNSDMYTVVLKSEEKSSECTYKLDTKVTGEGSADVFIKTLNEEELQNSTSVVTKPNDKVEISFKAEENTKINSLSLVNNDTKEVVSTVTGDEIEYSLIADEKGYYNIGYSTSYSNYSVVLDTQLKHKIEIKSITGMDTGVITFDESINPEMILKDEKVEFTVSEDITEMYVNTIDDKNKLILETLDDGSKKVSFTMPNEDVCLLYKSSKSEFSQDEDNYNLIKSYSDLENAIKVYNNAIVKDHNFRLANDITAPEDSVLTTSFGEDEPFNGVFDGNSHKISNLTLSPKCTSLFANLTGTIKDLEVESNIVVDSYKDEVKSNYSGLVDYAQNASIENIDVNINMDINGYLSTSTYVGGVVSRAFDSTINNCTANGEMTVNNFSTIFIGGIAGTTESTDITNCTNNANISNYYVKTVNGGGIVGKDENSTIQNVVNNANISNSFIIENSNTGGICGISTESEIKSSQNKGAIILDGAETINSGGIVGVGQSTNFENVINDGNITATTNDYYYIDSIGGIVGMSTAPLMIASCTNNATLSSDSPILYIGGILGKGQSTIIDSKNQGIIETLTITEENQDYTYINSSDFIGFEN